MSTRNLAIGLALLVSSVAWGAEPVVGTDYERIQPAQPTDHPDKIEVLEFFSYGCPHCAALHDRVAAWAAGLPSDVAFVRVPVGFGRPAWANLARAYYALEDIGAVDTVDAALYHAIHDQRVPLVDEKSISDWLGKRGVDVAKFTSACHSFTVETQLARANQLAKRYRITGVPSFIVDGRYVVIGRSEQQMIATAAALVDKARSEKRVSAR